MPTVFVLCGSILLAAMFLYYEDNALQVTSLRVNCHAQHPLKIVHLSDLHGKQFGKHNKRLLKKIGALQPDMVVFTGDLVNDERDDAAACADLLGALRQSCPVFYVPGNHEHRHGVLDDIKNRLKQLDVTVLTDRMTTVQIGKNTVHILGLDENQGSRDAYKAQAQGTYTYKDNSKLLHELEQQNGLKLVLSHYPENFALIRDKSYQKFDFDLMLSGHAHGGQFILPFFGGVYSPGQGIRPKYYRGLHGNRPYLSVSRGMGNSSFPFRIWNRPEIVQIFIT